MTARILSHSELQKAVAELESQMYETLMRLQNLAGSDDFMSELYKHREQGYRDGIAEALDLLANPTKYKPPADHLVDERVDSIKMTHEGTTLVVTKPGWSWQFDHGAIDHAMMFDTTEDLSDGLDHIERCECNECRNLLEMANEKPLTN